MVDTEMLYGIPTLTAKMTLSIGGPNGFCLHMTVCIHTE